MQGDTVDPSLPLTFRRSRLELRQNGEGG